MAALVVGVARLRRPGADRRIRRHLLAGELRPQFVHRDVLRRDVRLRRTCTSSPPLDATVDSHIAPLRMYSVTPSERALRRDARGRRRASPASTPTRSAASPRLRTTRATATSGRSRGSAGRPHATRSLRPAPPPSRSSTRASTPRTPTSTATSSPARRSSAAALADRPERPRHADGRHRRRGDRQRQRHRGRRLCRRQRSCPSRSSAPTALGQDSRHHRGRRLGGRPRRRRHPHVLLEPRLLASRSRPRSTTRGRRASCSSRRPATTARPTPTFPAGDARRHRRLARPTSTDTLGSASNFGAAVFLAAPGEGILTTSPAAATATSPARRPRPRSSPARLRSSRANDRVGASNGVIVGRLARNADAGRHRERRPATAA